jgi:hypothetical protein
MVDFQTDSFAALREYVIGEAQLDAFNLFQLGAFVRSNDD